MLIRKFTFLGLGFTVFVFLFFVAQTKQKNKNGVLALAQIPISFIQNQDKLIPNIPFMPKETDIGFSFQKMRLFIPFPVKKRK